MPEPIPFELPVYCVICGARLKGGATVHKPSCPIGRLIADVVGDRKEEDPDD
jgi:hypothetical protein